jgi:hypothetical protein
MSYEKMSKKELLEICEKLNISSYKTKNKPELILMILNKEKNEKLIERNNIIDIIEIDSDDDSQDELNIFSKNIVIETEESIQKKNYEKKINELYTLLHKANMNALNIQFKYRAKFPIAVYNNLQMLKQRINAYNYS